MRAGGMKREAGRRGEGRGWYPGLRTVEGMRCESCLRRKSVRILDEGAISLVKLENLSEADVSSTELKRFKGNGRLPAELEELRKTGELLG